MENAELRARLTKLGASSAAEPGRAAGMLAARASGQRQGPPPDEALPPHTPLRTNRTRRVPHPVLIGHAASLTSS